ncbi:MULTISPECIES: signal peptidase I [Microbacterium]|jgi:signal peptidase I|uniref:Signal peptidase I n=2 Tax=Microbacterium TaxID=33882 RepID=A0ABU1HXB2_9MICO|nr:MULTISPECIES: signal peptidase I [Microbacterium]MDQ1216299.1 signal peptidase I [Microbacterium arborescens]MDR6166281.1 signal peptidase I [Microbacterium paludicola]OAZ39721.1 signal peptidase I [Microbacterium arborescens]OWP22805.1 signal peptidase I [Microbacterium sp. AISO3]OYC95294.1 signal peptidase I [Microbacterium sp. Yaish 1]
MTTDDLAAQAPKPARSRSRRLGLLLRDILVIVAIALAVSFLVKTFLVRSFYIPSGSMERTLLKDDRILVDQLTPRFGGYARGDVVVFRDPGGWLPATVEPARPPLVEGMDWVLSVVGLSAPDSKDHLIKRIIGMPGDHVVCCNAVGQITVNDVPIDESSYVSLADGQSAPQEVPFDVTVPENSLWVLGDNRDHSRDSRYNRDQPSQGFVPLDNVVGRAFLITWPLDRFGLIDFHHDVFAGVPAPEGR